MIWASVERAGSWSWSAVSTKSNRLSPRCSHSRISPFVHSVRVSPQNLELVSASSSIEPTERLASGKNKRGATRIWTGRLICPPLLSIEIYVVCSPSSAGA